MARRPQEIPSTNSAQEGTGGQNGTSAPSIRATVAALSGMAAAWIAAGSTGLLAHPLRHALTWIALAVVVIAAWPKRKPTPKESALLAAALVGAACMTVPATAVYNVLAVTLVLAMLAFPSVVDQRSTTDGRATGVDRQVLRITSLATAVLAVYRLACTSIPTVWSIADATGSAIGRLAELIWQRPLSVGATFGGLDFLVLMLALYVGWLASTSSPRLARAIYAAVAVVAGHMVYLFLLSCSTDLRGALPDLPPPPESELYIPPDWHWSNAVRAMLPWNVPLLAGMIQMVVAAAMLRSRTWLPAGNTEQKRLFDISDKLRAVIYGLPVLLAALTPVLTVLAPGTGDLTGKKIVAYEHGYLDWDKPEHGSYGQQSSGMYGMLPTFVASLGGRLVRSDDLAEDDLADADLLLLIHPDQPWPRERLDRVWEFVRRGGSLLLVAEPRVEGQNLAGTFNDVLEPTDMQVRFDTAIPRIEQWQHSYEILAHPACPSVVDLRSTTDGMAVGDDRNRFAVVLGSSIRTRWPARPILVGRWGWSDPGSDALLTGSYRYDPGEKLGDLVLAAEERIGSGTVVVLADTASLTNQFNVNSYPFTGRLLAYLAHRSASPQASWRQALGLLACLGLLGLILWRVDATQLAAVAVVLPLVLAGCRAISHQSTRVLPDGRAATPNNLAYIDASHVEAYSGRAWTDDGIAGLVLTLTRNGYLPLLAPDLAPDRLEKAGLLISIAPARRFSDAERRTVRGFVTSGGIFICTAGAEHARAIGPLLGDFGFGVPHSPVRPGENSSEPEPMGYFATPYLRDGDSETQVLLYEGWPIECPVDNTEVLARGFNDLPVIAVGYFGKGKVVLIGDTGFAMNKNLEHPDGEPFRDQYENAHFWRWLIAYLSDRPPWLPPVAEPAAEPKDETSPLTAPHDAAGDKPPNDEPSSDNAGEKVPSQEVAP